jgi:hypothetical protein
MSYWWESQKEKRPLGRPRRRWIDNIKMYLLEIGLNVVDWISLAQDRDIQEPYGVTSQKTPFFIVTAVKTSNLTNVVYVCYLPHMCCVPDTLSP